MRISLLASTAILIALSAPATAADFVEKFEGAEGTKPAVSGINGKFDIGYGYIDIDGLEDHIDAFYGIGSLSVPVGHSFGLQLDAGIGQLSTSDSDDLTFGGAGAHLFWRNPDAGLFGLYGHYVNLSADGLDADAWRYGVEGELYLDRVSIEAFAGADMVDGFGDDETFFNGELIAAYYFTDNFRLDAGIVHQFEETLARVGAEAALPFGGNNFSLYTTALFGDDITSVRGGLRVYFGESGKSLIGRHREDDPKTRISDYFALTGATGSEPVEELPPDIIITTIE